MLELLGYDVISYWVNKVTLAHVTPCTQTFWCDDHGDSVRTFTVAEEYAALQTRIGRVVKITPVYAA